MVKKMTIERAIEHAKLVASEQMMRAGKCTSHDKYCDKFSSCVKCAEEHKQLAQWLEELKEYKELEEKLCVIFAWDCSLSDVVENLERQITEPDKDHPLNARILTYEDAEKWNEYMELEDQGLLVRLPCKVGDIVYADSAILPIEDMECYEDIDNKIPSYFQGRVVSFRFAKRNWVKIAVKEKWLHEWIDDETGPESDYIECEKNFSILLSTIGENIFLNREEAEKKLEEMKGEHDAGH